MKTLTVLLFSLVILIGCDNVNVKTHSLSLKKIKKYFQTENATVLEDASNNIKLTIKNSKLVAKESEKPNNKRWPTNEPFASIGALLVYQEMVKFNDNINNIVIELEGETFSYNSDIIEKILRYRQQIASFLRAVSEQEGEDPYIYLGDSFTQQEKDELIKIISSFGYTKSSEVVAFNTKSPRAQIYSGVQFSDGHAKTFIFLFLMDRDDKIQGFQIY